jgi:hypothetical protein
MSLADIGGGDNNMTNESIKKFIRNRKNEKDIKLGEKNVV